MAIVCSLLAWVIFVHFFSQEDFIGIIVCPIALSLPVGISAFFGGLILRDTIRRSGMWGINFKRIVCPQCRTRLRRGITFPSWKESCYGGWTCHECGLELSQWGRPWKEQNTPAKWAVLRAAEDVNEQKRRLRPQDERILNMNDQTQRGEAS
jgi:hypothetical protein